MTAPAVVDGPVPKHQQLREILVRLCETELAPDSPVPSERELMAAYSVSRATVREAIGQLVTEGRLYRVRGKGTFVAPPRVESQLRLASFTEDMGRRGLAPSTLVLSAQEVAPPPQVAAALHLAAGDTAYRIERLRRADETPMAVEVGWYTARYLPGLLDLDLTGSLYTLFAKRYRHPVNSGTQTVWAEAAGEQRARLLAVPPEAPLLVFRRTSMTGHVVLEHVTSWYRADRYQVHMSLDRPS